MSTIAINRENYTVREENVSLKERSGTSFFKRQCQCLPAVQTAEIMSRGTAQNEETE